MITSKRLTNGFDESQPGFLRMPGRVMKSSACPGAAGPRIAGHPAREGGAQLDRIPVGQSAMNKNDLI